MAEAFSNSLTRAAGIQTSYSGSTIGAAGTSIKVTAATGIGVSHLLSNANLIAGTKAILVGGTFANNTTSQVNLTVSVYDQSSGTQAALASEIPVPAGSSFVITDTGKTVLEGLDEVRLYTDVDNAIDANLSILTGVS